MAGEKCTSQLPALRVSERLEMALMRLAALDDRPLSEYIRVALERHCFGHAAILSDEEQAVSAAMQRNAAHESRRGSAA